MSDDIYDFARAAVRATAAAGKPLSPKRVSNGRPVKVTRYVELSCGWKVTVASLQPVPDGVELFDVAADQHAMTCTPGCTGS